MSENSMSIKDQIHAAEVNLERLLEWVNRFDNKSLLVLGLNTAMLGALSAFIIPLYVWSYLIGFFAVLTIALLGSSLLFSFSSTYPQTEGPSSLLYFETAAQIGFNEYREAFLKQTDKDYLDDLLNQCHRNSQIFSEKSHRLKCAYLLLILSILPWMMTIHLSRFS